MAVEEDATAPHLLLFPWPSAGHIIPIVDLAHLLLKRGMIVTVLIETNHLPLLQPILSLHPLSIQPLILSPPPPDDPSRGLLGKFCSLAKLRDPIIQWFRSHPKPPSAIVSDFFLGWTQSLALDLGVPRVVFWASGSFVSSVSDSVWRDLPENEDPGNDKSLISFPKIPNSPVFQWGQLSHVYRGHRGDPDWGFFRECMLANLESWGLIFNSFEALEGVYIEHLKKDLGHDRVWAVGPLLPNISDTGVLMGSATNRGGSSSVPPDELRKWLDRKEEGSVVYVCFGSIFAPAEEQMEVLAAALEISEVSFVWSVKANGNDDEDDCKRRRVAGILDGLENGDGKERGLIIRGWAPQLAILGHRAVGAFVSHCGWNSVLEGILGGVKIVAWPMGADQFINAMLLVDQLGVAVRACEGGGTECVPDRLELARIVRESVSKSGAERGRVEQLRDAAREAIMGRTGSSSRDLEDFVKQLCEQQLKRG